MEGEVERYVPARPYEFICHRINVATNTSIHPLTPQQLGIPTANIPLSGLSIDGNDDLSSGIYYGFCALDHSTISSSTTSTTAPSATTPDTSAPTTSSSNHAVADLDYNHTVPTTTLDAPSTSSSTSSDNTTTVYPTVLSIGFNPYYKNTQRSIEIHILHNFDQDFYGATLSLVILGFIRPEYDYVSKEALVEDIREDIRVAKRSLEREAYGRWKGDEWLRGGGGGEEEGARRKDGVGQRDGVGMCQME